MSKSLSHSAENTMRPTKVRARVGSSRSGILRKADPQGLRLRRRGRERRGRWQPSSEQRQQGGPATAGVRASSCSVFLGGRRSLHESLLQSMQAPCQSRIGLPQRPARRHAAWTRRSRRRSGRRPDVRLPRRADASAGSSVRHRCRTIGAAGVEAAAGGRRRRVRDVALEQQAPRRAAGAARACGAPGAARHPAAPACRDGAAGAKISSLSPISTIRPRYITATRVAMCRTTARSWAMKT